MEFDTQALKLTITKINGAKITEGNHCEDVNTNVSKAQINFKETLAKMESDLENSKEDITTEANNCNNILDVLLELLQSLLSSKDQQYDIFELPISIGLVLVESFKHCRSCEKFYASSQEKSLIVKNIFKKSNLLLSEYLKLLTETFILCTEYYQIIVFVFETLMTIARTVITLDIKTTAELWKYFIILAEQHPSYMEDAVLSEVAEFFSEEISCTLKKIVDKEVTDPKNIERTLKLSHFLLRIFLKMIDVLGDECLIRLSPLYKLLNNIQEYSLPRLSEYGLSKTIVEDIRSHISIGADLLISSFISNKKFVDEYSNQTTHLISQKTNIYGCLTLSINIMKNLLQKDENIKSLWTDPEKHIVVTILNNIQFYAKELMKPYDFNCNIGKITLYEYLLINVATFTISLTDISIIEKTMFNSLLNDNLITAIFVSDLWVILSRFGSPNYCYSQVQFLCNFIILIQSTASQIPQICYLSHLLYKLFMLLSPALKFQILNEFCIKKHVFLWTFIGLEWLTKDKISFLNDLIDFACKNVDTFTMEKETSPNSFNSMMYTYEVISTIDMSLISEDKIASVVEKLMYLWSLVRKSDDIRIQESGWFIEYINSLCKITSRLAENISTENWISILEILSSLIEDSYISLNFITLNLLECFNVIKYEDANFQNILIPLVAQLFSKILETENVILKLVALENFGNFSQQTCNEKIITLVVSKNENIKKMFQDYVNKRVPKFNGDDEFKEQIDEKFEHNCPKNSITNGSFQMNCLQPCKKIKLNLLEDNKLEMVINEILKSMNELKSIQSKYQLSDLQKTEIVRAKSEISKIIKEL